VLPKTSSASTTAAATEPSSRTKITIIKISLIAQSSGWFLIDFDQRQLLLLLLLCACRQRACVVHHVHSKAIHAHAWIWLVEEAGLLTAVRTMDRCAAAIARAACR